MQHINEYILFEREPAYLEVADKCRKDEVLRSTLFGKRIAFGTAGLRGPMRSGINAMNCGTVWRASQGLCRYWLDTLGEGECQRRCAVVGFDGRHNSEYLASITAAVFMSKGIRVLFADEVTATPLTPFLVKKYHAICGVQVTASHNPKEDNGYKVYSCNGAQIIPPVDKDIAACIEAERQPWIAVDEIVDHQLKRLNPIHPARPLAVNNLSKHWVEWKQAVCASLGVSMDAVKKPLSDSPLTIVYTAIHGVGYRYVKDLLVDTLGFPAKQFHPVPEQMYPDPEFSTVRFPNPEEAGALDLAKKYAEQVKADYIIANDPDADRFAAAQRQPDGTYRMFTGDELGSIFGMISYGLWRQRKANKLETRPRCSFVCSAVSCKFMQRFSEAHPDDTLFKETLTGFKWMVNEAYRLRDDESVDPCFCYEEALGYGVAVEAVPDKCGVSAALAWLLKATEFAKVGGTTSMGGWLDDSMKMYGGFFATDNSYFRAPSPTITKAIIDDFRARKYNDGKSIGGFAVKRIRDLGAKYDTTGDCGLPCIDEMLTIKFENGACITLRGSGTEPKLKYYSEMVSDVSIADAKTQLSKLVNSVLKDLMGSYSLKHASEL